MSIDDACAEPLMMTNRRSENAISSQEGHVTGLKVHLPLSFGSDCWVVASGDASQTLVIYPREVPDNL
jgi:hypothetical protein